MVLVPHPGKVPTYQQILFFEEVTGILECANVLTSSFFELMVLHPLKRVSW